MTLSDMAQAAKDFWRPNQYELKRYLIEDGKQHPFALICPGGGYGMVCSFVEGLPYARELNKRGYHAFVLYYRVKKKARYPAPQEDLERAIREILAHAAEWKVDPRGWSLWGSSAGGHLAASYCTEKRQTPKPSALVLTYPVITMGEKTHAGSRDNLLGKAPTQTEIERLSVERQADGSFPPTYLWCGTADTLVDPENSLLLDTALTRHGVPHVFETLEGVGHGVGLGDGLEWFDHAVKFWEEKRPQVTLPQSDHTES